ncbi:MAG: ATP-binding protein, partial [Bacteroidetes bacterium]|nr:ATP-binding protein [Bacteroidota bacterium]
MVFKNFRVNAGLRILLLIVTIFLLLFTLMNKHILTTVLLGVFTVYQIFSLYQFVDRTNRHLASFLESIRFSEFTRSFNVEGLGSSFDQLNKAFNDVIQDFQAIRSEKEEHFHYLQNVVQNTDVSIIAYLKDGTVDMINKAAKKLFQISDLKNIKGLEHLSPELVRTLLDLKPGHHYLIKVQDEDDLLQLAIFGTEIKLKNKFITLVTIKNIQNVLEDQETEAWQKLIRVLTHEIMNSITPIASISSTLDIMLKDIRAKEKKDNEYEMDKDTVIELHKALQTINKRSIGLLHFVNTYRNLTRIPKPNFKITNAKDVFENIIHLMEDEIKKSGINIEIRIEPEDLQV